MSHLDALLEQSLSLFSAGQEMEAMRHVEEALAENPKSVRALAFKGYMQSCRPAHVVRFEQALEFAHGHPPPARSDVQESGVPDAPHEVSETEITARMERPVLLRGPAKAQTPAPTPLVDVEPVPLTPDGLPEEDALLVTSDDEELDVELEDPAAASPTVRANSAVKAVNEPTLQFPKVEIPRRIIHPAPVLAPAGLTVPTPVIPPATPLIPKPTMPAPPVVSAAVMPAAVVPSKAVPAPVEDIHRQATVAVHAVALKEALPANAADWFADAAVATSTAASPLSMPESKPKTDPSILLTDPWEVSGELRAAAPKAPTAEAGWSSELDRGGDANADGLNRLWSLPDTAGAAQTPSPASPWDEGGTGSITVDLDHAARATPRPRRVAPRVLSNPGGTPPHGQPDAPSVEAQCRTLMARVKEHHDLGDFSGSLEAVEKVLELDSTNAEARDYMEKNAETLQQMYASKLGNLDRIPQLVMTPEQVIWLNLHHKAGFILSRVDGMSSYEDILSLSTMPRLDTMRILAQLLRAGVIKVG